MRDLLSPFVLILLQGYQGCCNLGKNTAMKKTLTLLLASFILLSASAQSYEGTVDYQKKEERAIIIEFDYSPAIVERAIIDKMMDSVINCMPSCHLYEPMDFLMPTSLALSTDRAVDRFIKLMQAMRSTISPSAKNKSV